MSGQFDLDLPAPAVADDAPESARIDHLVAQLHRSEASRTIKIVAQHEDDELHHCRRAIESVFDAGKTVCVAFSAGKDSSCLLGLTLLAAFHSKMRGASPRVLVLHVDTGVENPEIRALAHSELSKASAWSRERGLDVGVSIVSPAIGYTWPVRVIGGRGLPSFPDTRADCQLELKVWGAQRRQRQIAKQLAARGHGDMVVMTGVRSDESVRRADNIRTRGEKARELWRDSSGMLRLSPLIELTSDDVWTFLGLAAAGRVQTYSDFAEVMRVYQDAGGSSCVIVADERMRTKSKPCSSRFGCWACTAVAQDHSGAQMLKSEPERYGYMQPLADLRQFIANTQYDWSRRTFIGRTIKDGYVTIAADGYSPNMLKELLRYTLTAQADSGVEIIGPQHIVAIDARWSLYGIAPAHTALRIWQQYEAGRRWAIPKTARYQKTAHPVLGKIYVGEDWSADAEQFMVAGLNDPHMMLHYESCGTDLRTLRNGRVVMDWSRRLQDIRDSGDARDEPASDMDSSMQDVVEGAHDDGVTFDVDEEGAQDFLQFLAEDVVRQSIIDRRERRRSSATEGYFRLLRHGIVSLTPQSHGEVDRILQRTHWRERHGLDQQRELDYLLKRLNIRNPLQQAMF